MTESEFQEQVKVLSGSNGSPVPTETKERPSLSSLALGTPFLVAGIAFIQVVRGFSLQILWGWFVTPAIGLPVPSVPACIGLSLVVLFFGSPKKLDNDERVITTFLRPNIHCAVVLATGWIVTRFM